jgi:cell division protein FtsB
MKKITARNEGEREKKRGAGDMRSMPLDGGNKKPGGGGPRFTKVAGAPAGFQKVGVAVQSSDSKKEETPVEKAQNAGPSKEEEEQDQLAKLLKEQEEMQKKIAKLKAEAEAKKTTAPPVTEPVAELEQSVRGTTQKEPKPEDVAMSGTEEIELVPGSQRGEEQRMDLDDEDENITWEQYDFTKPTGCDHTTCPGCKTDGIWDGDWPTTQVR